MSPGYRSQDGETPEHIERMQFDACRKLSIEERADLVSDLCRSLHELSLAGLRARHPDASEAELEGMAARIRLGDELYEEVKRNWPSSL